MNKFTRIILHCLFLICSQRALTQELPKLRLDLDRAYGGAFSNYLDSIEYIPLETTRASMFGQVSQLIITDSSFVITDTDTKSVLFFSTSGKFLKRISRNGALFSTGAIYDVKRETINIAFENTNHNKLLIDTYSLTGNFVSHGNLTNSDVDIIRNSIVINEDIHWIRNKLFNLDSASHFRFFSQYKKGIKVNSVIPLGSVNSYGLYRLTNEIGFTPPPIVYANNFYFSTPIEHRLYQISAESGKCESVMHIIFSAKFGIKNDLLALKEKKQMDSVLRTKWFTENTILSLENIYLDQSKLIFKIKTGYFGYYALDGTIATRNFLYRFQNNSLVAFEKIHPDSSTYFLPFCDPGIISFEGFHFNKSFMYTHISSLRVFASFEATKSKNQQYPVVLEKYFKTGNRKNNPVIVRMKLKE